MNKINSALGYFSLGHKINFIALYIKKITGLFLFEGVFWGTFHEKYN